MDRRLFKEEHEIFRGEFRKFLEKEAVPHTEKWEREHRVSDEIWRLAGENGFLCPWADEKYGGLGADFLYSVIIDEETARVRTGFCISLHNDVCAPYIDEFGTDDQKARWMPGYVSGETVLAVAMTEPHTGSDLAGIKATAISDGDHYVVNGAKTFITNGQVCDQVITAVKTDPKADPPYKGVSLLVVDCDTPGFQRGKVLEKIGLPAQDTSEMFFEDCRVPKENLLGEEGQGFYMLMAKLQQERLIVAIGCQTGMENVLEGTIQYTQERTAFGRPISKFQNTKFKLVEVATEVELGRNFVDRLIEEHMAGNNVVKETSMAKYWVAEMFKRNVDTCLQFYGGYGYMLEYPIAKAYLDARVQTIYAGTTEIMKEIVAGTMGL